MFLGGANHTPEFRLASYVNVLRWWWRFLALGRYGDEHISRFWEAVLFGWSGEPFGRKRITFRLSETAEEKPSDWKDIDFKTRDHTDTKIWLKDNSGLNYLSAQGLTDREPVLVAKFAVHARIIGTVNTVNLKQLRQHDHKWAVVQLDQSEKAWEIALETLRDAMALIGLLGGLGARSRRGFGSLAISGLAVDGKITIPGLPTDLQAYQRQIADHLGQRPYNRLPPYTAYCSFDGNDGPAGFTHNICAKGRNAEKLMNAVGWAFQGYRSWGQRDREGGHVHYLKPDGKRMSAGEEKPYQQSFKDDHDNFYANNFPANAFDNRSVFGLPHNYGNTIVDWGISNIEHHRRASPLLFHFHMLANDEAVFVANVAPANFLPDEARLRVAGKTTKRENGKLIERPDFTAIDYRNLHNFPDFIRTGAYNDEYEPVP